MADERMGKHPSAKDLACLQEQLKKANGGDQQALTWLREFLDRNPAVWQFVGDLARVAERAWIKLLSNGDALAAEAIKRRLDEIKSDLIGANPNPVEQVLGDQVMATHLEARYLQALAADAPPKTATDTALLLKRVESAQKRHLAAVRTLVEIRRMLTRQDTVPYLRVFQGYKATG